MASVDVSLGEHGNVYWGHVGRMSGRGVVCSTYTPVSPREHFT
jgi:hypothetical protein